MKKYKIKMNDEHRKIIIESLELNKSLLNFDFNTIVQFVIRETNKQWLNDRLGDILFKDRFPDYIQEAIEKIEKPDMSQAISTPITLKIDDVLLEINHDVFAEREVCTMMNALDLSSRVVCGQLLEVSNVLNFSVARFNDVDVVEKIMRDIKALVFKNLGAYASYGIYNNGTPLKARISYEMIQVLRHEIWKNTEDRYQHVVSSSPVHHETGFPLIEIEFKGEM